ncbi:uroporphyrinogen decarboxylase [Methylocystis sp. WRRC1]|uniref:uroporphyrinogen decarboxylase n=1 Tax=Methylocystis sp. WRRC1 TaxID=1732014 RepID=UPI001D158476|nr:uroporphyrinogen decarboxylase [Methylocystis sp. WRRC1]MCC3245731.1 uroporphyrinogen decarboxylase [Methylocystis sp. WRRC1]
MSDEKALISALRGKASAVPPMWLMRQAGRYLPEYRALRSKAKSFLDFCYTPAMAAEVTLQPVRRFHFDAAILFSDILVIPDAMGQTVSFETGSGPRLDPIETPEGISRLGAFDITKLSPVFETIDRVKSELPTDVAFIGFCGAPWTVASYMIAGQGTPDQAPARLFAFRHPDAFSSLIDRLVDASVEYLVRQIDAGVEVVQIFDSWAGVLPANEFEAWSARPIARMIAALKTQRPNVPVIAFVRGADAQLPRLTKTLHADGYGLDTALDPKWAAANTAANVCLQGNLDPLALIAGGAALDREIDSILGAFAGRPHIFNLGHGILPQTPIEHVERLVERVRGARD